MSSCDRRTKFICDQCGSEFLSLPRKTVKRYCSRECQIDSLSPSNLPDEEEVKRRARIIRELSLQRVVITKERLDWYDD